MERWDKWNEAELNYLWKYEGLAGDNRIYGVGETVRDRVTKLVGIVVRPFEKTGLYVMFPQYDTAQLVRASNMEKVNGND